jgi:hypothetical protein
VHLFFILPLWLLCILVAIVVLFFRKYRFLATHLVLCSTGALVGCFIFVTLVLFAVTKIEGHLSPSAVMAVVFLISFIGAGCLGGLVGLASGFFSGAMAQSDTRLGPFYRDTAVYPFALRAGGPENLVPWS